MDGHEEKHKYKVTRNIGTDGHLRKAIQSHTSYNSLRVGSPNRIVTLLKKRAQTLPLSDLPNIVISNKYIEYPNFYYINCIHLHLY